MRSCPAPVTEWAAARIDVDTAIRLLTDAGSVLLVLPVVTLFVVVLARPLVRRRRKAARWKHKSAED